MINIILIIIILSPMKLLASDWTEGIFVVKSGDASVTGRPRMALVSHAAGAVVLVVRESGKKERYKIVPQHEYVQFINALRGAHEGEAAIGPWVSVDYVVNGEIQSRRFNVPVPNDINLPESGKILVYSAFLGLIQPAQQGDAPEPATNANPALPAPPAPAR